MRQDKRILAHVALGDFKPACFIRQHCHNEPQQDGDSAEDIESHFIMKDDRGRQSARKHERVTLVFVDWEDWIVAELIPGITLPCMLYMCVYCPA